MTIKCINKESAQLHSDKNESMSLIKLYKKIIHLTVDRTIYIKLHIIF